MSVKSGIDDIIVNMPAEKRDRVIAAFVGNFGYKSEIIDPDNPTKMIPNPQSEEQFASYKIMEFIQAVVHNHESHAVIQTTEMPTKIDADTF